MRTTPRTGKGLPQGPTNKGHEPTRKQRKLQPRAETPLTGNHTSPEAFNRASQHILYTTQANA